MAEKPLLILPEPAAAARRKRFGGVPKIRFPSPTRQRDRFDSRFSGLERTFRRRGAQLRRDMAGAEPEQVVVLETVGSVQEFYKALRRTEGLEWLGDWDRDDFPADEYFSRMEEPGQERLPGRIYLILFNQQGLNELLRLWNVFRRNPAHPDFRRGFAKWRHLFQQLRDIHLWGPRDRIVATGLAEDWQDRRRSGQREVLVQVELWFRGSTERRDRAESIVRQLVEREGGTVRNQVCIEEIAYHAILARLPIGAVGALVENPETRLVQCEQVMFFRPTGQAVVAVSGEPPAPGPEPPTDLAVPSGLPVTAILDGLPLENHVWLRGRIIVDDPDGWAADVPGQSRIHGTGVASLIVHGELDARDAPLARPVYIRPILRPDPRNWAPPAEFVPDEFMPVDLVDRAVRRLIVGEGGQRAVVPSAKIINLSVGDRSQLFDSNVSPWGKLIDYLAWRFRVLFVISAGNYADDIDLGVPRAALTALRANAQALERRALRAIRRQGSRRRLLSPAESINALTVAAVHDDRSALIPNSAVVDLFDSANLPSPLNALGLGFRRAVKPDVLIAGGRQLYRERLGSAHPNATLETINTIRPPGQRVAAPGPTAGDVRSMTHTRGTSNASALLTRAASQLYEVLIDLRGEPGGTRLQDQFTAVLLKGLLVHGSEWGTAANILQQNFANGKDELTRFLGYGCVQPGRLSACTDERATLIGCSELRDGEAHRYHIPLPSCLNAQRIYRRLIITLAWLTPVNSRHHGYRRAELWFDPYEAEPGSHDAQQLLDVRRRDVDWRTARRGTVQHEIFEGERASAFPEGSEMCIQVNCRADAGELAEAVPYALVVTVEVAPGLGLPIYQQIREIIAVRVGLQASSSH